MRASLKYILLVLLFGQINLVFGQNYNMSNGTVNTCSGTFYDSGGNGGAYNSGEDITFTVCPNGAGLISMDFTQFNVEDGWDFLYVYDGDDTGDPSLGVYSNGNVLTGTVQATPGNPTGCLTFRFTSDGTTQLAGWRATISCVNPCQLVNSNLASTTPAASGAGPIRICQGDNVSFTANGVYPENGNFYAQSDATSNFVWDFGDGSTATGTTVSHNYPASGLYITQVTITDVNNCKSTNTINQVVEVSTTPIFDGTNAAPNAICLGETAALTGVVTPVEASVVCTTPVADNTYLPDGSGVSYETSVPVSCFLNAQTLGAGDIVDICLDLEHSYLGDLDIVLECPNGQTLDILDYGTNGGGGAILGQPVAAGLPVDDNTTLATAGNPFTYCWTPGATNGNLDDNEVYIGNYTSPAGQNSTGVSQVPGGSYEVDGNWNDLAGCPLNGDWTIIVTDNLGSDNGYIFQWGINFDPAITPPTYQFTPVITSEGWQANPDIVATAGNNATVQPSSTGVNCYTYEVTDNHGCNYDTTVCLTVNPGLTVFDQTPTLCENPVGSGSTSNVNLTTYENAMDGGAGYTFTWFNDIGLTSPVAGPTSVTIADGQVFYGQADDGNCTSIVTVTFTVSPVTAPTIAGNDETCGGFNDGSATVTPIGMNAPYSYVWAPAPGAGQGTANGSGMADGVYTVTVTDDDGCAASNTVTIDPGVTLVANIAAEANQCLTGNSFSFDGSGSTISSGAITSYTWDFGNGDGATGATPTYSYPAAGGPFTVTLTVSNGTCTDDVTQNVTIYPMPTVVASGTAISCNGANDGTVNAVAAGTSGYTYNWDVPAAGAAQTGLGAGTYTVTVSDVNGCPATDDFEVTEPPVITSSISGTNVTCNGDDDGSASATASGGTGALTYAWSPAPTGGQGTLAATGLSGVTYTITITDASGCAVTETFTPTEPTVIAIVTSSTDANCGATDGSVSVTSTNGGTGVYTSTVWTDASNAVVATPGAVGPGSYTVTVTDDNGCEGTSTEGVAGLSGPTASIVSQTNASCSMIDDGTATVSASGGTGAITYTWSPAPGGGQGTTTATGLVGGQNYTLTAEASGCPDVINILIGTDPDPTVNIVLDQDAQCNGVCDGEATANVTNGTAAFTYLWDNLAAETGQQATQLCIGTSNVTITDANGCTATGSVVLTEPTALTLSITGTDPQCNLGTDGSADVTIGGGTAPYNTSWTHGPNAEDLNGVLGDGTYTLNVTDDQGCTISESVTISEPAAINSSIAGTNITCNGDNDGTSAVTASGGTGTLDYSWLPVVGSGATTANVGGLSPTTYTVTITDDNMCTATESFTPTQPSDISFMTGFTNSNCGQADGEAFAVTSGGTPGYTYVWQDGALNTVGGNANSITGVEADTYTVTVTDDAMCVGTTTVTVSDAGGATLSTVDTDILCFGESTGAIDLSIVGGTPGFTFDWTGPGAFTASTEDLSGLTEGTYNLTMTDNVGCVSTISVTINEPTILTVTPSGNPAVCNGASTGSADVIAGGGNPAYTFNWFSDAALLNNIGSGASIGAVPTGTYYVEVTDANLCTMSSSIFIDEPAVINITASQTDASCGQNDGTLIISETTGGTGVYVSTVWTDAGGAVVADPSAVTSGNYTVTVTDDNGCVGTAIVGVQDRVGPTITITSNIPPKCFNGCDGSASVSVADGLAPYTYLWAGSPTGQGTGAISDLCDGQYTLTVTDANGCQDNVVIDIVEPTEITVAITANNDPSGNGLSDGTASGVASGGTPTYTYEWFNGCPATSTTGQTGTDATGLAAGDYTLAAIDDQGCPARTCVTIDEPETILTPIVTVDAECFGGCDGSATVSPSGGVPGYTYEWFTSANVTTGQTTAAATNLCAGDYYVVVADANSVSVQSNTITIDEPDAITGSIVVTSDYNLADISCFGLCDGEATATIIGGTGTLTYLWNDPSTQTSNIATGLCDGTFTVVVEDDNNCTANFNVTLSQPTQLTNSIVAANASCFDVCDGTLTANALGGTPGYTYQWNDPALTGAVNVTGLCDGTYDVIVTDANGCILNDSETITEPTEIVLGQATVGSNCGQADGEVTVTIVSGDGPLTVFWDAAAGNSTDFNVIGLAAGCYDATVSDVHGCTAVETVCIVDLGAPDVEILTLTNATCHGVCDGFAQVQVTPSSNSVPPLGFEWFDENMMAIGQSTASATNLCVGNYIAEMTDGNGCTATIPVEITEPDTVSALVVSTVNATCYNDCDGSLTVLAAGGTVAADYGYAWNDPNGQASATATGLCDGTYSVSISDDNGCTISISGTISEPLEILASATDVDAFCNTASGSATVTVDQGGVGTIGYLWTPSGATTATANNLVPNIYDVTVTDADGCTGTTQITVGNIPEGTATAQVIQNTLCNGSCDGMTTVSMGGSGTAPYTYEWFNATTGVSTGQTTMDASGLCAGDYFVEVTDINTCLSTSNTITITEPLQLALVMGSQDANCKLDCNGEASTVVSGGRAPYSYVWDDPLAQNGSIATGLCASTYNVIVKDDNDCEITDFVAVAEPNPILLDSTVVNANCNQADGSACVTAAGGVGGFTYSWPTSPNTTSCESNLAANSYIVVVTDANFCSEQIVVEVSDLLGPSADISASTDVTCFGLCNGAATVNMIDGGGTTFTVKWDGAAGAQTTPTVSNLCEGTYTVEIEDDLGCIASTSVTISQPDVIATNQSFVDPLCFGYCDGELSVVVAGGTTPYSYVWRDAGAVTIGGNTAILPALCSGDYSLEITDDQGCVELLDYTLTDPAQVSGSTSVTDVQCNGACDGIATATPNIGIAPFTFAWAAPASQTTSDASGLCPGTYDVRISDADGCFVDLNATISEPDLLVTSIPNFGHLSCFEAGDGFAQVDIIGGTPPYSIDWNGSGTNQLADNLSAGNYTVDVTDALGCTSSSQITITEPQALSANSSTNNNSCYQSCDGNATVTISGGTLPYTYQWDDPAFQTTPMADNICAGQFNCTIEDDNGCTIVETVNITQPTVLAIAKTGETNTNCGQPNGSLTVSAVGGVSPYTYAWNDPANTTTANVSGISAGCYQVSILDGNGCAADSTFCISDIAGPTVTLDLDLDVTCFQAGNGGLSQTSFSTTGGLTYELFLGTTSITTGPGPYVGLDGGTYNIIVEDAAGCIGQDIEFVFEPTILNSAITSSTDVNCYLGSDGQATVSISGGSTPYGIVWNDLAGQTTNTAAGLTAGTYTATITDNNNCQHVSTVVIDQPDELIGTPTVTDVLCNGNNTGAISIAVVGGTPAYNYNWTPMVSTGSQGTNLTAGTYNVTITDGHGCVDQMAINVTQPNPLEADMVLISSTCSDCNGIGAVDVDAINAGVGPYTYQWLNGGNNINDDVNNGLCEGFHEVIITDANGCTITLSDDLEDRPAPIIDDLTFISPLCFGNSNGSAEVIASSPTNETPLTYTWDNGSTGSTVSGIGEGTISVTVKDANDCIVSDLISVTQPSELIAIGDGDEICFGQTGQMFASGQGGTSTGITPFYDINWSNGATGNGPVNESPTTTTTYNIDIVDANGCIANTTVSIFVHEELVITAPSVNAICIGESLDLTASANGGHSDSSYVFIWDDEFNVTYPETNDGTTSTITADPLVQTMYYVEVTDGCSTPAIDSVEVIINALPEGGFAPVADACTPNSAEFNIVIPGGDVIRYDYDFNCDGIIDLENSPNANVVNVYDVPGVYDVCVVLTTVNGCTDTIHLQDPVEAYPVPTAEFSAEPWTATILDPIVSFEDESSNHLSVDWDFGDGSTLLGSANNSDFTNPTHEYDAAGTYDVELTVTNSYGCVDSVIHTVYINPDFAIYVPNSFTPDGDGKNDFFFPQGEGLTSENYHMYIFNRWGEIIFESHNLSIPWDGSFKGNGKVVQTEVFVWLIETVDHTGKPIKLNGHVTLLK